MIIASFLIGNFAYPNDESGISKLFTIVLLWIFFFTVLIGWTFISAIISKNNSPTHNSVDGNIQRFAAAKVALRDGIVAAVFGFLSILPLLSSGAKFKLTLGIPMLFFCLAAVRLFAHFSLSQNRSYSLAKDRSQALLCIAITAIFYLVIS